MSRALRRTGRHFGGTRRARRAAEPVLVASGDGGGQSQRIDVDVRQKTRCRPFATGRRPGREPEATGARACHASAERLSLPPSPMFDPFSSPLQFLPPASASRLCLVALSTGPALCCLLFVWQHAVVSRGFITHAMWRIILMALDLAVSSRTTDAVLV